MKIGRFMHPLRSYDWVVLAVATAMAIGATVLVRAQYTGASTVAIRAEGQSHLYSLEENRVDAFTGPLGRTIVETQDSRVRVREDPGPQQICVRDGWIERSGEWLACLPNQVFLRIEGSQTGTGIDALAF